MGSKNRTNPGKTNIIPVLRCAVEEVWTFAEANQVGLVFEPEAEVVEIDACPGPVRRGTIRLLRQIIAYVPPHGEVRVSVVPEEASADGQKPLIRIVNTGLNLTCMREALLEKDQEVEVVSLGDTGTRFEWQIPGEEGSPPAKSHRLTPPAAREYPVPVFYRKLRKHMQACTTSMKSLEEAVTRSHGEQEQLFLKKANAAILANLGREDFDVAALARALALSRTQLYRHLKALTRLSPSQYIRFIRLQKAKEFLETGEMTVGEAAFQTGFVDKSYFTRAFHRQFGFNPSYLKKPQTVKTAPS